MKKLMIITMLLGSMAQNAFAQKIERIREIQADFGGIK